MLRAKLATLVANPLFERFIIAVIVVNAITLGLETSPWWMERFGPLLSFIDKACLAIFVAEIAARLTANFTGFWRDPWRIFDFTIVAIALMPATGAFSVLARLPHPARAAADLAVQGDPPRGDGPVVRPSPAWGPS
jgi:voltage-gated sodium channel